MSPGNAGGAKGSREMDELTSWQPRLTTTVPNLAILFEAHRVHVTRYRVTSRSLLMLTIHEWVKGMRLCRTRALFLSTACASICQSCIQVIPSTGEPCAGDPHARFGGEGDREFNRSSLPLSRHFRLTGYYGEPAMHPDETLIQPSELRSFVSARKKDPCEESRRAELVQELKNFCNDRRWVL